MAWLVVSSYVIHIYLLLTSLSLLACSGDVVLACFVPKMDVEDRHWIAKEHVENNWSFVHTTGEFGTRPGPTRSCRKNRNISCYLCTFFTQLFLGPLLLHHHRDHIRDPVQSMHRVFERDQGWRWLTWFAELYYCGSPKPQCCCCWLVVDDDDDRRKIIRSGVRFVFGNEACLIASPNLFLRGTT